MANKDGQTFEIPSQSKKMVADLFTTQEQRDDAKRVKVIDIPITEIDDFPDHPYPVEMDDDMIGTLESVKQYGVHTPALVRHKDDGRYEMISGHRRKAISEMCGINSLPCIVKDINHDEATIMMVDCNIQRENVPPCVKGKAYKMKLDAM